MIATMMLVTGYKKQPEFLPYTLLTTMVIAVSTLAGCDYHQNPGNATPIPVPAEQIEQRHQRQQASNAKASSTSQILFGDLHVHTTLSPDAFITAMPIMGGSGSRPPAMACDFARYCSALDFWSINDHAEGLTPLRWQETKDAVRECNAIAGNEHAPDLVTFLGWEWSQVNHYNAEQHYGHKNVIFLDTDDDKVPARPIAAPRDQLSKAPIGKLATYLLALQDLNNKDYYQGIQQYYQEIADIPHCEQGVNSRELPVDCHETAKDPKTLFSKLRQQGFEHMVIPHGNAWGLNTPPGTSFDKQLTLEQHSPEQQFLFELYSGHGNSEEYRDYRAVAFDSENRPYCPLPSNNYEPCCWRAGKIIRKRCEQANIDTDECVQRELIARQNYIDAGVSGHLTVPGQRTEDWLNCGQCEDCFNPGMDHRPGTSAQYALALSHFEDASTTDPLRFRFGFIGASDNHSSRAGSGYKEFGRFGMTEANGIQLKNREGQLANDKREPLPYSIAFDKMENVNLNIKRNMERQASFWLTGGLVAVHSDSRGREDIWTGLKTKNAYATSGDRILLWFDLVSENQTYPMGSEVSIDHAPTFSVNAIGAFEQLPGCPAYSENALGAERLQSLCNGECYNPGNQRKRIERIEIVRIKPQRYPNEPIAGLIEDPWRSFDCPETTQGCEVSFTDQEFVQNPRETIYYARAIQQNSLAVNAGGLRCERDSNGQCVDINPCYGDFRTDPSDDCLAENQERAWSSPIFVNQK